MKIKEKVLRMFPSGGIINLDKKLSEAIDLTIKLKDDENDAEKKQFEFEVKKIIIPNVIRQKLTEVGQVIDNKDLFQNIAAKEFYKYRGKIIESELSGWISGKIWKRYIKELKNKLGIK